MFSTFFSFFLFEFWPESVSSVLVRPESVCFSGFSQYELIRHELACIGKLKKKKKNRHGTDTKAMTLLAAPSVGPHPFCLVDAS